MKPRILLAAALLISALGAAAPSTRPAASPSARASYSDRYGLLEDRNIFVRERSSRRNARDRAASTTQAAPRPPEEKFVLTGVVLEDEGYRAYVEDVDRMQTLRLAPGDTIARGRVVAIMLDAIAYEPTSPAGAGQRTWVEIGFDLTGKPSTLLSAPAGSSATTAPTPGPVIADVSGLNPNDPNLSPEQRMKLRRAQELQKKQ